MKPPALRRAESQTPLLHFGRIRLFRAATWRSAKRPAEAFFFFLFSVAANCWSNLDGSNGFILLWLFRNGGGAIIGQGRDPWPWDMWIVNVSKSANLRQWLKQGNLVLRIMERVTTSRVWRQYHAILLATAAMTAFFFVVNASTVRLYRSTAGFAHARVA